jgi:hypothetical protein
MHRMPQIGELGSGVWLASGFGGHGLNTTAMAGNLIARAIVDGDQTWRQFTPFELVWAGGIFGRAARRCASGSSGCATPSTSGAPGRELGASPRARNGRRTAKARHRQPRRPREIMAADEMRWQSIVQHLLDDRAQPAVGRLTSRPATNRPQ